MLLRDFVLKKKYKILLNVKKLEHDIQKIYLCWSCKLLGAITDKEQKNKTKQKQKKFHILYLIWGNKKIHKNPVKLIVCGEVVQ